MNCFRFLNFKSFDEVEELTPKEYELLIKAAQWKRYEEEKRLHWSAFLNRIVEATDKKGKYIFNDFKSFFNEDEMKSAFGLKEQNKEKANRNKRMAEIARKVNSVERR